MDRNISSESFLPSFREFSFQKNIQENEQTSISYKKRPGTSSISGQLYETKLLSFIHFTMQHDDGIKEFYIGTNMDQLGEFDDIGFRFKANHINKPIAVFLQAKHKLNLKRTYVLTITDLAKYFRSYLKIKNKFNNKSEDVFFETNYDDIECAFIYYTNATLELKRQPVKTDVISKINSIISTGDDAVQHLFSRDEIKLFYEVLVHEKIHKLSILIADIVKNIDKNVNVMNDDLIKVYHVFLMQKIFRISDVEGYFKINDEIVQSTDEYILLLKDSLVLQLLKENEMTDIEIKEFLSLMFLHTCEETISRLIGSVIIYRNNRFEFIDKNMNNNIDFKKKLGRIDVPQSVVDKAMEIAGRKKLRSYTFNLPIIFGNRNMNLECNDLKQENQLSYLARKIVEMLEESKESYIHKEIFNVAYIDKNFSDVHFIESNEGIACLIGNLLVLDDETKLLMFNSAENLDGLTKNLLHKINNSVKSLERYRFDIKVPYLPKLTFDCDDDEKNVCTDFTKKLLFYTNQSDESNLESNLKKKITRIERISKPLHSRINTDTIFLAYHDIIHKRWITNVNTEYITKQSGLYESSTQVLNNMKSLLSIASDLCQNKIIRKDISFDIQYINILEWSELCLKVIIMISKAIPLSVTKLIQTLQGHDFILLDLYYLLSLPDDNYSKLHDEIKGEEYNDSIFILIISQVLKLNNDIKDILRALKGKRLILVTNDRSIEEKISQYFTLPVNTRYDKISLAHLTSDSVNMILENTDVIFQGVTVKLKLLVNDDTKVFIKEEQLNELMNTEYIILGDQLTNIQYDQMKDFYISRNVTLNYINDSFQGPNNCTKIQNVETLHDIDDQFVLIAAGSGMGKSSLLTHLSLKTKALNPNVWIMRINLSDTSRLLNQYKRNKVVIDILEAIRFVCVGLANEIQRDLINKNDIILNEKDGEIILDDQTNLNDVKFFFYINMFLNYYNKGKVIFLFDAYDEICPHFENEVTTLIKVIKDNKSSRHLIWVTSRSYNEILKRLEQQFGEQHSYILLPLSHEEQIMFIERFLHTKINLNGLNVELIVKIDKFMRSIAKLIHTDIGSLKNMPRQAVPLFNLYLYAAKHFKNEIKRVLYLEGKMKYIKAWDLDIMDYTQTIPFATTFLDNCSFWVNRDVKNTFVAIPLHIYMLAEYYLSQLSENDTKWDQLAFNTFFMYERFVESKFIKIRWEVKNKMNINIADVRNMLERERKEFMNKHKKLAAYAMFYNDVDLLSVLLSETDRKDIEHTINKIKFGHEKTGVIDNTTQLSMVGDIPCFVHYSFAEHFAVEYISDLLKVEQPAVKMESLWNFVLKVVHDNRCGLLELLDTKLFVDKELNKAAYKESNRKIILNLLIKQSKDVTMVDKVELSDLVKSKSSLECAFKDLSNLTSLFLSTLEFVDGNNIEDFCKMVVATNLFQKAISRKKYDFIYVIINTVKKIDESKVDYVLSNVDEEIILKNGRPLDRAGDMEGSH